MKPEEELLGHLNAALDAYHKALDMITPDAVDDLAVGHAQLGAIYSLAGDLDRAMPDFREAIRYMDVLGDFHRSGQIRYNVAFTLAGAGRFEDALDYARAALRDFGTFDDRAAADTEKTKRLIAKIEQDLKAQRG